MSTDGPTNPGRLPEEHGEFLLATSPEARPLASPTLVCTLFAVLVRGGTPRTTLGSEEPSSARSRASDASTRRGARTALSKSFAHRQATFEGSLCAGPAVAGPSLRLDRYSLAGSRETSRSCPIEAVVKSVVRCLLPLDVSLCPRGLEQRNNLRDVVITEWREPSSRATAALQLARHLHNSGSSRPGCRVDAQHGANKCYKGVIDERALGHPPLARDDLNRGGLSKWMSAKAQCVEEASERPDVSRRADAQAGVQVAQLGGAIHRCGVCIHPLLQMIPPAPIERTRQHSSGLALGTLESRAKIAEEKGVSSATGPSARDENVF
eukprot:scaffold217654_cov36-Tisochrysis_lutea.AAC.1